MFWLQTLHIAFREETEELSNTFAIDFSWKANVIAYISKGLLFERAV